MQSLLLAYLSDWRTQLQSWAVSGALVSAASQALELETVPSSLAGLNGRLAAGEWSDIPRIELLSRSGMGGAIGAWSSTTQTIYLNSDWLAGGSKSQVSDVLTEEFGHYLDSRFNKKDTQGDEGEYFSLKLRGKILRANEVNQVHSDDDTVILKLPSGEEIRAEGASLSGGAGNDNLSGTINNDTLDGGTGADGMAGGLGNDTYLVDNTGDTAIEEEPGGIDTVESSISFTLGYNIENLTLTGTGNINATGNGLNNILTGNSGDNIINGGTGADAMAGGLGNDTYLVDNTGDTVIEEASAGTDTVQSSVDFILSNNIENLTLTGKGNINATGNELNNILTGNWRNNIIDGGTGVDAMAGAAGNDTYLVDNTEDTVIEEASAGTDTVQSSVDFILGNNIENLTLTGTGNINATGNGLNNILTGNSGNNILAGAAGNDTYLVDNTGDTVMEEASAGTDTVQSSVSLAIGNNIENLTLTGTENINATGNGLNNILAGNSGNNILAGGAGNDTYLVDNTGDTAIEEASAGADTVQSSVSFTIGNNIENLTLTGTGNINATGNGLNNILTGNSGKNILAGGAGNDTYLVDNAGDTVIEEASAGTDTVRSSVSFAIGDNIENLILTGTGNINATGNGLDNILTGNSGNNNFAGGAGNDTYRVDNTGDTVTEEASAGTDTVQSSITYALGANVENLTLTFTAAINGTGNTLNNTLSGNEASNVLVGGDGADVLTGLGGADTLRFALTESRLASLDRITDFAIGTDILDGPTDVSTENTKELGTVATLNQKGISALLTRAIFGANQAATFTFVSGSSTRTFLALNDGTTGFSSTSDGLIEITGYSGALTSLAIT
ncbi:hypothetical protein KBY74_13325 [Cyanobium sp. A1C-AMD]|uniref:beta strand repeat-containing protein n=1 Tax=Cyanobium sp. A1C-AMD TaxID=2823694 RepID=UPI0020CD9FB4|nr:bluetail domain-containing putative surface protein [Cyanobium sp. A1C-AMD]MCP9880818.1 hypothetical protein [Cyanobium sp. A1C-AMD]